MIIKLEGRGKKYLIYGKQRSNLFSMIYTLRQRIRFIGEWGSLRKYFLHLGPKIERNESCVLQTNPLLFTFADC